MPVLFLVRSWSSLVLHPLDFNGSVELLLLSLNHYALSVPQGQVGHCLYYPAGRVLPFGFCMSVSCNMVKLWLSHRVTERCCGLMLSMLEVWVLALPRVITLCSWTTHVTLTVPLPMLMNKSWVPANLNLEGEG